MGYVKTDREVNRDNSALMRNIRKNENALGAPPTDVGCALLACKRSMGAARRG